MNATMLRGTPFTAAPVARTQSRTALRIEANKKVQKKEKIILIKDVPSIGPAGTMVSVPLGYFRNHLQPSRLAKQASEGILLSIQRKKDDDVRSKLEEKAQAQAFANALSTIGKFILKKRVGEKDQIFGSVTKKDVSDAVYQQTGRALAESDLVIPDIKSVGIFECSVQLHPEVRGVFNIVIQKEKQAPTSSAGKKKVGGKK